MQFPQPLINGIFVERANRFLCWVERNGRREKAHLPNSGRLKELLAPGRSVYLVEATSPQRSTKYDMLLVAIDGLLVSVDARLPSALVEEGWQQGRLAPFGNFTRLRREVPFGHSRLDLLLERDGQLCYGEVKSITLVEAGLGLFPDAPTLRGRQHLESLIQARRQGHQAAIIFVVQRPDATGFAPNDKADPAFGQALRRAWREGVDIYAYRCQVSLQYIQIWDEIPVYL